MGVFDERIAAMKTKHKNIITGLAAGLGAAAAVVGVRALVAQRTRRRHDRERMERVLRRIRAGESPADAGPWHKPAGFEPDAPPQGAERSGTPELPRQGGTVARQRAGSTYLPADQPDVNPVTLRSGRDTSPELEEPTRPAEPSAQTGFPPVSRATRTAYSDNERRERGAESPGDAAERAGLEEEGEGTIPTAIPMTGSSVQAATTWGVVPNDEELATGSGVPLTSESLLVEYLLGLHRMVEILRERRQDTGGANAGMGSSLEPADRAEFQSLVDRLESQRVDYGKDQLIGEGRDVHIQRLTMKIRDALENLDYTDDDLFRIYGEVRSEACQEIRGQDGFDAVRGLYECS
jgi:hypothetical protein